MKNEDVIHSGRHAGLVKRYHTWPVIREQTVAEHTWQVMRIWWTIFGDMSPIVSSHILWHDGGEVVAGDGGFGGKQRYPELKSILDKVEEESLEIIMKRVLPPLSQRDRLRLKCCDLLEMLEHALVERGMGNRYADIIYDNVQVALDKWTEGLTDPVDIDNVMKFWIGVQKQWTTITTRT